MMQLKDECCAVGIDVDRLLFMLAGNAGVCILGLTSSTCWDGSGSVVVDIFLLFLLTSTSVLNVVMSNSVKAVLKSARSYNGIIV